MIKTEFNPDLQYGFSCGMDNLASQDKLNEIEMAVKRSAEAVILKEYLSMVEYKTIPYDPNGIDWSSRKGFVMWKYTPARRKGN